MLGSSSRSRPAALVVLKSPALGRATTFELDSARAHDRPRRPERHPDRRRRVRVRAPRALRAAPRRRLGAGHRLDERHLRERRAARSPAAAHRGRRRARRRDRPEVRALRLAAYAGGHDPGRRRRRQRGRLRDRAAAVRGRRRDGRRAGRRGRVEPRGRGAAVERGRRQRRDRVDRAHSGGEPPRLRALEQDAERPAWARR